MTQCHDLAQLWLQKNQDGLNLFYIVSSIFGVFFLWSLADLFRSIYLDFGDKIFSGVVFVLVAAFTIYLSFALRGLWDVMQIEQGFLQKEKASTYTEKWVIIDRLRDEDYEREIAKERCKRYGTTLTK